MRRRSLLHLVPFLALGQGVVQEKRERKPNVVLISGDAEMDSESSLSRFTSLLEAKHGMRCTVLTTTSSTELEGADALESADHSVWFLRGLRLPAAQLRPFQDYAAGDKPLVVIGDTLDGFTNWPQFRSIAEKKGAKLFRIPSGKPAELLADVSRKALLQAIYQGLGKPAHFE